MKFLLLDSCMFTAQRNSVKGAKQRLDVVVAKLDFLLNPENRAFFLFHTKPESTCQASGSKKPSPLEGRFSEICVSASFGLEEGWQPYGTTILSLDSQMEPPSRTQQPAFPVERS